MRTPCYLADATLTPDGLVVAGDADGLLRFWDAETGDKLWTLPAHKSAVIGIHLEGADIVTRDFTGEISRWRLPAAGAAIDACSHHTPLRYRSAMKKPAKLLLRKETIRTLSEVQLTRVGAGADPETALGSEPTDRKDCPAAAVAVTAGG